MQLRLGLIVYNRRSDFDIRSACWRRSPDRGRGLISLREVVDEDVARFHAFEQDAEAAAMAAFRSRAREAFEAHWARIRRDETVVVRTVLVDGEVAGNVTSFLRGGAREVGYWIGREHWGRGVATEALRLFLAEAEPRRPLSAGVALGNTGSMRVLEKCGFGRVGEEDGYVLFELPQA